MTREINLNADLGESFGPWRMGDDAAMLKLIGSASIACGFHAGDPWIMQRTLRAAGEQGVSVGAHPSFPDLQGFGRRRMTMPAEELEASILYQLAALDGMARAAGLGMTHVKPHGALNNMASEDTELAQQVVRAIKDFRRELILLAPAGSHLAAAGQASGLTVAGEIFADRAYTADGHLVPRGQPGAVLDDPQACVAHVLRMLDAGGIVTASGRVLPVSFHSICVHGDSPHAVRTAETVRTALQEHGWALRPLPELAALG